MAQEFELVLPNRVDSLSEVTNFITEIGKRASIPLNKMQDVLLAVDEACTNIIQHASKDGQGADFTITCQVSSGKLTVCLVNQGKRFDPTILPPAPSSKTIADLTELSRQGRGIMFMHHFMDEIEYEYHPQKGNILYMTKGW